MRWVAVERAIRVVSVELVGSSVGHLLQARLAGLRVALTQHVPHLRGEPPQLVAGIVVSTARRHSHAYHGVGDH